jgi:Tfp pilus assembly protein PilF
MGIAASTHRIAGRSAIHSAHPEATRPASPATRLARSMASVATLAMLPLLSTAIAAVAAPYTPASGADVITTLPRRADPQQQAVQALRGKLAGDPRNAALAAQLAQRHIALGRTQADPRHYGQAQAALAPWWDSAAPPPAIRLLRATLLQSAHHYAAALADLDAITRADPGNAQAWLTRAVVLAVTGEPAAAATSCARLAGIADDLAMAACLAGTAASREQQAAAERLLGLALARTGALPVEELAWARTAWAELAERRGDAATADARYRAALAAAPGDTYLLAARADFLLARQRPAEALALVDAHARADALLLRRALALQQLGQGRRLRQDIAELSARFDAALRRGDRVHQREQAVFTLHLLGNARGALALALENWSVQKEAADARIALEAALAARDPAAAKPVLQWLRRTGFADAAIARLAGRLGSQA